MEFKIFNFYLLHSLTWLKQFLEDRMQKVKLFDLYIVITIKTYNLYPRFYTIDNILSNAFFASLDSSAFTLI